MAASSIGKLQHHVSMSFTAAEVTEKDLQEFWVRAICHLYIDALPVAGLEEVVESIVDNYNRHVVRPWRMASLQASPVQRMPARLGAVKQRPAFHLGDE
jgi:hypothetical protein